MTNEEVKNTIRLVEMLEVLDENKMLNGLDIDTEEDEYVNMIKSNKGKRIYKLTYAFRKLNTKEQDMLAMKYLTLQINTYSKMMINIQNKYNNV